MSKPNCFERGYHFYRPMKWIDKRKLAFLKPCRYCDYIYSGQMVPLENGGFNAKCMNPDVGQTRGENQKKYGT